MFSVFPTPRTSVVPMPPTPMHAMLSVSLGAWNPRPSTWRGPIVKLIPAATSPTNLRLEIRLRAMTLALPWAEQQSEKEQDRGGEPRREDPEARPLLEGQAGRAAEEPVVHVAGHLRADEHADAVGDQDEEPLRLAANRRGGFLVHVDLAGHE